MFWFSVYGNVTTVVVTDPVGAGPAGAGGARVTPPGGDVIDPGGAKVGGAEGVAAGVVETGCTGIGEGRGTGVPGTIGLLGVPPPGAGGASAAMLLVRKVTFAPRAFNALGVGAEMPPAAGSISSSQAPHLSTEST